MRRVIIVGAHGQDGRLLQERVAADGDQAIPLGRENVEVRDASAVEKVVQQAGAEEVYYLAAFHQSAQDRFSHSPAELMRRSMEVHVTGLVNFLEAIRLHAPETRLFYAASSHVFGNPGTEMQNEQTSLAPICAYGISKTAGVHCCRYYRSAHAVFAAAAFLYNHESPYRGESFVSQKIIRAVASIARGQQKKLVLADLEARVDWGYAVDTVDAMRRILAHPAPEDFVVGTGKTHSVKDFVEAAFTLAGLDWRAHVEVDPTLLTKRRSSLCGDATKLRACTGWRPRVEFDEMVRILLNVQYQP